MLHVIVHHFRDVGIELGQDIQMELFKRLYYHVVHILSTTVASYSEALLWRQHWSIWLAYLVPGSDTTSIINMINDWIVDSTGKDGHLIVSETQW